MKNSIFKYTLLSLSITTSVASVQAATVYDCKGGGFGPVKVEIQSKKKILVNDTETGTVDAVFERTNPNAKTHKIIGDFKSLGNGLEGFIVDVTVSKTLMTKSKIAFLNTSNRGPGGAYYRESYKCLKR